MRYSIRPTSSFVMYYEDDVANRTYPTLTKAVAEAMGVEYHDDKWTKRQIWDNFICAELCQNFIPRLLTKRSDFRPEDYDALKELIKRYDITKMVIFGAPSFDFVKDSVETEYGKTAWRTDGSYYHHWFYLGGRCVDVIYAYHPSAPQFLDKDSSGTSRLIPWLKKFFN